MKGIFGEESDAPRQTRIKICGITNAADALTAIDCGADALGFNFFPGSPRYIDISSAGDWIAWLPRHVLKIAVLVNPTIEAAIETAQLSFINALQLHGDESPEFCRTLLGRGITFAKAIGIRSEESLRDLPSFSTPTILLDSRGETFGGSGQMFPWDLARQVVEDRPDLQIILAGGLTPENITDAIRRVRPFGIDVTSGVESSPGRKDPTRIRAFIEAARADRKES